MADVFMSDFFCAAEPDTGRFRYFLPCGRDIRHRQISHQPLNGIYFIKILSGKINYQYEGYG